MSILVKVLSPIGEEKAEVLKSSDASKRQKLCGQETGDDQAKTEPLNADAQEAGQWKSIIKFLFVFSLYLTFGAFL